MLFLCKVRSPDERKAGGAEITGEWKSGKALLSKRGTPADHTHTKDDRLAVTGVSLSCLWWWFHWCSEVHSLILGNFFFVCQFYLGTVNNTQRRRTGGAEDQARPRSATLLPLLSHVPVLILDGPLPSRVFPRALTLLLIFSHSSCLDLMSSQISYSDLETRLHSLCSCRSTFTEAQGSADTGLAFPAAHWLSGGAAGCGLFPKRAPLPGQPCLMGCLESSIPSRKHSSTENRQHSTTNMAPLLPRRHTDGLALTFHLFPTLT